MSKIKNMSRGGWIVVGLMAALVLVPTAAVAATATLVKIQGPSGNKADVSPANQLLTTEADAANTVALFVFASCSSGGVYTVPTGHAFIITGVDFYLGEATAGSPDEMDLYDGSVSSPCTSLLAAGISSDVRVTQNQIFQPGIPVPAGDAVGMFGESNESGSAEIYGYLVPAAAVPASANRNVPRTRAGQSPTMRG